MGRRTRSIPSYETINHPVNTSGFAGLPNEMYLEILSHMKQVPVTCHTFDDMSCDDMYQLDRHFTLTSLSQTCQSLRGFFLSFLWETIEVVDGMRLPNGRRLSTQKQREGRRGDNSQDTLYTKELLRQLNVVTVRNPVLAPNVREMNIILTHSFPKSQLIRNKLYKAISRLPNLTTVRIEAKEQLWYTSPLQIKDILYEPNGFPQIRHAHLNHYAGSFGLMCPNLLSISGLSEVKANAHELAGPEVSFVVSEGTAEKVEVAGSNVLVDRLHKDIHIFPNLRDVTFEAKTMRNLMLHKVDLSNTNPHLNTIRVITNPFVTTSYDHEMWADNAVKTPLPSSAEESEWIEWCQRMLRNIQAVDREDKKLYFRTVSGEERLYTLDDDRKWVRVILLNPHS